MSNYKIIEDLVLFYVKENYKNYLKENNITTIPDNQIESAVNKIYTERKSHLEGFLKKSLKQILKHKEKNPYFVSIVQDF